MLGARTRDIVKLLVWQFSKPVVIANMIAWPVAWWVMRDWLNRFDARIALTPGPFVARRPDCASESRSAPSPATLSGSRGLTPFTLFATNRKQAMFRNYLTVGLRALAKSKAYAFINIFGLALGLAACVLILLYVRYEESYDGWMQHADQAFQLQTSYHATNHGGESMDLQASAVVAGRALKKDFPQVEKIVYIRSFSPVVIQNGQPSRVKNLRMVDGDIFDILQVPFVRGDPLTVLNDTHSAVLSESEAKRRFGSADPIGKTLTIVDNQGDVDYRVTGIFKDIPKNSSFSAEMVARFDPEVQFADQPAILTNWGEQDGWIYVKLRPGADVAEINREIPAWEKRNIPDEVVSGVRTNEADEELYRLVNIRDIHLGKAKRSGMNSRQRPRNDRDLRADRPARACHGLHKLHQSGDGARLPAGARGRLAQGAGSEPAAARRPVRRRIPVGDGDRDGGRARHRRAAAAVV